VMDLAPDAKGKPRRVVIQLMPPPFSQGWIGNIRKLAAAQWWDGTSINRVQDNYVVQWGDAEAEDKTKARTLPAGIAVVPESDYSVPFSWITVGGARGGAARHPELRWPPSDERDSFSREIGFLAGWPIATEGDYVPPVRRRNGSVRTEGSYIASRFAPVHCYGMVGVGRDMPPDTGSGAELYVVIGHAPRHLDRNIALVGRVIEGIEHLSSLPRGTGALGFYETAEERTAIQSIWLASDLPSDKPFPAYEYLSTESPSFAAHAEARANRRDPFFIRSAGGADICNIPVPVRRVKG
jgi:cyclophilin family peptidyl-prolyl cis-trans isomerase